MIARRAVHASQTILFCWKLCQIVLILFDNYNVFNQDATNGEGPDLIIEMLANVNLEKDLTMIKRKGRIVVSNCYAFSFKTWIAK